MSKYPNLREIHQPPPLGMSEWHLRALRKAATEVRNRTGAEAWIDTLSEEIVFGFRRNGDIDTVFGVDLFRTKGVAATFHPVFDRYSVDDVCYVMWLARQPLSRKKKQLMWNEHNRKADEREAMGRLLEEDGREWLDRQATRGRVSVAFR